MRQLPLPPPPPPASGTPSLLPSSSRWQQRRRRLFRNPAVVVVVALLMLMLMLSLVVDLAAAETTTAVPSSSSSSLGNEKAALASGAFNTDGPSARQDFCSVYRAMVNEAAAAASLEGGDKATTTTEAEPTTPSPSMIELPSALAGKKLTVSIEPGPYFVYDPENGIDPIFPGVHALILDHVAERGNFTWRDSFGIWTREEKGSKSITELLSWGMDRYDVMVGTYTPSLERMRLGVQFVEGHFDGSLLLIKNHEDAATASIKWFNFLDPFALSTWFVVIAVVVFSAFVYQFIEHLGAEHEEGSTRRWFMENLYLSFINSTGNYSYEPKTLGGRLFGFVFAFWAMLITAAYTANLASLLVVSNITPPKVKSISQAVDRKLDFCVQKGSYAEGYVSGIEPQAILIPVAQPDMYDSLNEEECDVLLGYKQDFLSARRTVRYNPECRLEWQGRTVQPLEDGFATRLDPGVLCTDLVNDALSYHLREMKDTGVLDDIWRLHDEHYGDPGHCEEEAAEADDDESSSGRRRTRRLKGGSKAKGAVGASVGGAAAAEGAEASGPQDPEFDKLGLRELAGTMLWQIVGSFASILLAVVSRCDPRTKDKRQMKKKQPSPASSSSEEVGEETEIVFAGGGGGNKTDRAGGKHDDDDDDADLRRTLDDLTANLERMRSSIAAVRGELEARANRPKARTITTGTLVVVDDGSSRNRTTTTQPSQQR